MPNSRRKGHDYERRIAAWYRRMLGSRYRVSRGAQSDRGDREPDIVIEPSRDVWIECGVRKQGCWIVDKYEQAKKAAGGSEMHPIVHAKCDRGDDLVIMGLHTWGLILRG